MKAGRDHAADPIATRMVTGLKRAYPLMKQDDDDNDEEVELSLGLSIGGNKRKAVDFLIGSFGNSEDPNRKCRARVEAMVEIRTRNPVVPCLNPIPEPVYMPVANGSGFSCMVSCCAPPVVSDSGRSTVLHPIPCRSLPPFAKPNPNPNPNHRGNGGKRSGRMKRAPSLSASPVSSSSGLFRGRSGSSGEARSHSNPNAADQKPKEQAIQEVISKPRVPAQAPPSPPAKVDAMPCVMTKGPDGKTISGFLYRYNEREVSIVCVCHGSSFSPAGFVRHAGGMESSHPLRQIVMVPSN